MTSYIKIQDGITRYVDSEILPHLTGGKRIAVGAYMALSAKNIGNTIYSYRDNAFVKMTGAVNESGVDVEALYNAASPYLDETISISVPLIGEFRFNRSDVDKLCQYMR